MAKNAVIVSVNIFWKLYTFHKNENIPCSTGDCRKVRECKHTRQICTLKSEPLGKQKDSLSTYCHGVICEVKNSQTEQSERLNETDTKLSDD